MRTGLYGMFYATQSEQQNVRLCI